MRKLTKTSPWPRPTCTRYIKSRCDIKKSFDVAEYYYLHTQKINQDNQSQSGSCTIYKVWAQDVNLHFELYSQQKELSFKVYN